MTPAMKYKYRWVIIKLISIYNRYKHHTYTHKYTDTVNQLFFLSAKADNYFITEFLRVLRNILRDNT